MFEVFIKSLLIGYSGAIMPGSLFTYTINKSIKHGAISGLLISLGHVLLEFFIVMLILFGFARFLGAQIAISIIGIIGGVILIYLAFSMLRDVYQNKLQFNIQSDQKNSNYGNMVVAGAAISAFNPGFIFWWVVVGLGLTMSAYTLYGITGVIVFYIGHICADITFYCFLSTLISKTRSFISMKLYKGIVIVMALFLMFMGVSFFYNSLKFFF